MGKKLFWVLLLIMSNRLLGNPVEPPHAEILAFKFDPVNKWELEIGLGYLNPYLPSLRSYYDSICIVTSSGRGRVRLENVQDSTSILVITPDSLTVPVSVNSTGDQIVLYSYLSDSSHLGGITLSDEMSFGNSPWSDCDSPPYGYSIRRFSYYFNSEDNGVYFCLSEDTTMGIPYDTSGCCATLTGYMFDKNGKKFTSGNFKLDFPVTFNADSTYLLRIYAMRYNLYALRELSDGYWPTAAIDSLNFDAHPDSVIRKDIHFINLTGIRPNSPPSNPDLYIINFPNPSNPGTNFFVRIPDNLRHDAGEIDIYNSIGQRVFVIPLSNASYYKWDGIDTDGRMAASGVYLYRLVLGKSIYKTGSMVLLK